MFVLSLIPYLSVFVSHNFYSFVPQACYGIDFIVVAILSLVTSKALRNADKGNVALILALKNNLVFVSTIVFVGIGMVIGYLFYPPAIIVSCLLSIIAVWVISYLNR